MTSTESRVHLLARRLIDVSLGRIRAAGRRLAPAGDCATYAEHDVPEPRPRADLAKLEVLGQMAGGIAHDLNQSLALISGYVDLIRHEMAQPDGAFDVTLIGQHLDIVTQAALDGGHIVKRLLAFARSPEQSTKEPLDVRALLEDVARLTAPRWRDAAQAQSRPIKLVVSAPAGLYVEGESAGLRRALINLVFNAVDALPNGGAIALSAAEEYDDVLLSISDTGTGMSPDVRQRLFEPFFTTKGEAGTGLGLAQVRHVVDRHGGSIRVDSTRGTGTTFELRLPRSTRLPPAPAAAANALLEDMPTQALRVLIVEDEPRLANLAARLLAQDHHTVWTVSAAEPALTYLEDHTVDVVVSDVGLGEGINGLGLAEEIVRRWPHIRIVLATGWGAALDPEEARQRGIHRVLAKPYLGRDLRSAVVS